MKGLIIGSFNPVHNGHIALFKFALQKVDTLTILFCYEPDEKIAAILRGQWLRDICREIGEGLIHIEEVCDPTLPYEKASSKTVSMVWADYILKRFGKFDIIFGSEKYVDYVAEYMQCKAQILDNQRLNIPVSSTLIRNEPFKYWDYIPSVVRPHFVKKVCLFGSESTGKSTMSQILAKYYETECVPEMARDLLGDRHCTYDDFPSIAYLQTGETFRKVLTANKLLICDSDLIITELYARIYFNDCPQVVLDLQKVISYDLYLFFEIDVPWVADGTRDLGDPEVRTRMRDMFRNALIERNIPFVTISGNWAERETKAIQAIDTLLHNAAWTS
jgi:HTH-type transcriptional regulator, transcriptional repressor of NAD biosynthesis genes